MVEQMEICAIKFGPDVDELEQAGLHTVPGSVVRSPASSKPQLPWSAAANMTLELGRAREIILRGISAPCAQRCG